MIHTTFEIGSAGSFDLWVSAVIVLNPGLCLELVKFLLLALELSPVFGDSLAEVHELELPLDDLKLIEGIRSGGSWEGDALLLLDLSYLLFLLGRTSCHELGCRLDFSVRFSLVTFTQLGSWVCDDLIRGGPWASGSGFLSGQDLFLDPSLELFALFAENVLEVAFEAGTELGSLKVCCTLKPLPETTLCFEPR